MRYLVFGEKEQTILMEMGIMQRLILVQKKQNNWQI